jgi:hypothetical protein
MAVFRKIWIEDMEEDVKELETRLSHCEEKQEMQTGNKPTEESNIVKIFKKYKKWKKNIVVVIEINRNNLKSGYICLLGKHDGEKRQGPKQDK